MAGTIIADRYRVHRLIARGGMAAVYLAHQVKLNRPVALKVLTPPPDAEDPDSFEERFRLEAETLASLDHPNIVILHDFGETRDGRFYLAMEYVEGPRLSDLVRDGPLHIERLGPLILQVCAALRYAHRRGVVHRDLKPSNLLIRSQDGQEHLKVVDFGLVKLTETDQSLTRAGLILGSPHCMAPEQIRGDEVDHRADIYAIGVLLFRCLTGHYPFHGSNSTATMVAHLNQPIPTLFSFAPELSVPPGLEEVIRRCLQKNPSRRFDSMRDLMNELGACLEVPSGQFRSVSQTHSSVQRRIAPPSGRGIWWLALGVAAVAAILLISVFGVGYWALRAEGPLALGAGEPPVQEDAVEERAPGTEQDDPEPEPLGDDEPDPLDPDAPGTADEVDPPTQPSPDPGTAPETTVDPPSPSPPAPEPQPVEEPPAPEPPAPEPQEAPPGEPDEAPEDEPEDERDGPPGYMELPDDLL